MFYKNNYFIVKKDDKVVGVGGYFSKTIRWDRDHFYRVCLENQIPIPESFGAVNEYLNKTFNLYEDSRNLCNISVDQNFHRKGVASFMLKKFIEMSGQEDIHLTVLADNIPAIRLYEKHGFKKTYEFLDYGGYKNDPVMCLEMRLIKN
ncbi:MAG TPA: GNAT family N-acetyltransferase [Bacilli bacterium]|nr:GNAT family N-acetyltransferase [Bacilli bacterium]